jgi:hypothetical protein
LTTHIGDFPFEETRHPSGDLFDTMEEARAAGFDDDQIWSVVSGDDEDVWVYGPPHHYINRLGFVATQERHDNDTYYEETF